MISTKNTLRRSGGWRRLLVLLCLVGGTAVAGCRTGSVGHWPIWPGSSPVPPQWEPEVKEGQPSSDRVSNAEP